jgi:thiamine-monophosphate kinase
MNEFCLIEQFFKPIATKRSDVVFGIGDDAACLEIPRGANFLISTDTLVGGNHFLSEWNPYDIACRAVMVNVSDMAAMAADPCWVTLALTLPEADPAWLKPFSQGLNDSLNKFNIALIGGDTTRGPLSITLTIAGLAPEGKAVKRDGAKPGDVILVSGQLGAAALAVKFLNDHSIPENDTAILMQKLIHPEPRVDLINCLRSYASAAIDISDGLSADLNHICVASGVGACLIENAIPVHPLLKKYLSEQAVDLALRGGDDYELCFTVPARLLEPLMNELKRANTLCYPIGEIESAQGLRIKAPDNTSKILKPEGYSHFS